MESKFKVGDKVRVLPLDENTEYASGVNNEMKMEVGKIVTVDYVRKDGTTYGLKEIGWLWDDDMLELANEPVNESATGFSIYLITGRVPGFPINTIVRTNNLEPGCYVDGRKYGEDELVSFAVTNAPQLFELIHKR